MKKLVIVFLCCLFATAAEAKERHYHQYVRHYTGHQQQAPHQEAKTGFVDVAAIPPYPFETPRQQQAQQPHYEHAESAQRVATHEQTYHNDSWPAHREAVAAIQSGGDSRPADCYGIAWCGCWMRHVLGVASTAFNLAINWEHYGSNAGGPKVGAVVVWPHHVGQIVGEPDSSGRWLVKSGNYGNRVATVYMNVHNAVAFRE